MSIDWTWWPSDPWWSQGGSIPAWFRPSRPSSIRWEARQTVAPTDEPVSLDLAKNYAKVDVDDDDELIEQILIPAARTRVEDETGLALMPQTWQLLLDRWPSQGCAEYWPEPSPRVGDILLPRWPVQSITSIQYTDSTGTPTTVTTSVYSLDAASQPARVVLKYGQSWPASPALATGPAIAVTFQAGATVATAVDPRARLAILRLFMHYYDNRIEYVVDQRVRAVVVPEGAQKLIDQLSIGAMVA